MINGRFLGKFFILCMSRGYDVRLTFSTIGLSWDAVLCRAFLAFFDRWRQMHYGFSKHRELLTQWQSTLMCGHFSVTGICRMTNLLGLWPDTVSYWRNELVSQASVSVDRSVTNSRGHFTAVSWSMNRVCFVQPWVTTECVKHTLLGTWFLDRVDRLRIIARLLRFRSSMMFCVTRVLRCCHEALPQELPSSGLRSSGILSRGSGGLSVLGSVSTSKPGRRWLFTGVLCHQSEH
jgi:hypothetical protein